MPPLTDKPTATPVTDSPPPKFRKRPLEQVSVYEGETLLLPCEVDNISGHNYFWRKDNGELIDAEGKFYEELRMRYGGERPSDPTVGDISLRLSNVTIMDSGLYQCLVNPVYEGSDISTRSNVTVLRRLKPTTIASTTVEDQQQQEQNSQQQPFTTSNQLTGPSAAELATPHLTKESQLQARAVLLPQGQTLQLSSSAFITPHASTADHPLARKSIHGDHHSFSGSLMMSWPYLLLGLAGILMLANIYLIYSLVKRHQRIRNANRMGSTIPSHPNSTSSSGSAASGSSSAGSSSSSANIGNAATCNTNNAHWHQHQQQQQPGGAQQNIAFVS